MIAVVGGTGRLGTALVPLLQGAGERVRVVSRRGAAPPGLEPMVAEVVAADVTAPGTLRAAVEGADVVVSAVHGMDPGDRGASPERVDHRGNTALVDAAAAVGAAVVLVSVRGAAPTGNDLQRAKWRAEQHLAARGIPWTVLRAPAYLDLWREVLARSAARDGRAVVLGAGRNPIAFVRVETVADALARACLATPACRVLEVSADVDLTLGELAEQASRPGLTPRHVPLPLVRAAGQLLRPVRPGVARLARMAAWMDTAALAEGATAGR